MNIELKENQNTFADLVTRSKTCSIERPSMPRQIFRPSKGLVSPIIASIVFGHIPTTAKKVGFEST